MMVYIAESDKEIAHGAKNPIVIKKIVMEDSKNSVNLIYRRDKEGNVKVSGFEVKAYGNAAANIMVNSDKLIQYGIQRMQQPNPKEV